MAVGKAATSKKAVKAPRKKPNAATSKKAPRKKPNGQRKTKVKTEKNTSKGGTGKKLAKAPGKKPTAGQRKTKVKTEKNASKATPRIKKIRNNIPKQEMPPIEDKRSILNIFQPVQTYQPAVNNTCAVQQHNYYHQVKDFTLSENPKEETQSTSEASSSSALNTQVVHFVDKHRKALIDNCALVDPILDGLLSEGLLTQEQYDAIRAEKTDQNKMRKLYEFIKGWSDTNKQTLYNILKKENRFLIENLEQS